MSQEIQDMFGRIARRYDRANRVLSFGIDIKWRKKAVRATGLELGESALDAACGTGDLSFALKRAAGPEGSIVGVDFTPEMVELAKAKAAKHGDVSFEEGDVTKLRFADDAFDAATISFGIRNVDDPVQGLREMRRVVRPDGRVVVLEFGQPRGAWGAAYRAYSRFVMPPVGGLITSDKAAYKYLPRTAAAFPAGDAFLDLMREAGFSEVWARPLSGGIAWLYVGVVD